MACETMREQGRQYQESNAALQAKLDNAIDTAFDLEAENAKLRKVVEAARRAYDYYDMVWDGGIAHELEQALAELDDEC